jgi:hypothetical protein
MFGSSLGLVRRGPDLLPATTLGADPRVVTRGECDAHPRQDSVVLSSKDSDPQIGRWNRAQDWPRSSTSRSSRVLTHIRPAGPGCLP